MTLREVIEALTDELPGKAEWGVAILNRRPFLEDPDQPEIRELSIVGISVDDEDREINLLTHEGALGAVSGQEALTMEGLFIRLKALCPRCHGYSLYSGSAWRFVGQGLEARHDVPLIGMARNNESRVFGFLQGPRDQWETNA